ncbi:type VII secretion-associated protein [uncultured Corynebacterium sp.]|uniref:type VII secretion-associated protein n=1 Tax=uncultured Corynebacterium sp. TaxID=159447 RepID=UPI0025FF722F|nr:type VII secretion-associated protein [uncultured Corynebacterium sp.]
MTTSEAKVRTTAMVTATRSPGREASSVVHLWGPSAREPDGDGELVETLIGDGEPTLVITPSYWGGRRRELLADEFVRRGIDPPMTDLATEVMALDPPTVSRSFLVEVEPDRMCVSLLDFDTGLADGRLSFHGGDGLAVVRRMAGELLGAAADDGTGTATTAGSADAAETAGSAGSAGDLGDPAGNRSGTSAVIMDDPPALDDAEFIVAGDDLLVADMRRRGWSAFPVPVDELGVGARTMASQSIVSDDAVDHRPIDGLDVAALRSRARAMADEPRTLRAGSLAVVGALACVACAVAITAVMLIVDGPVGRVWREESAMAAAVEEGNGDGGVRAAPGDATTDRADEAAVPSPDPGPKASGGASQELAGHGVRVELPPGWRVDESAGHEALVLVDDGPMRILVTAGEVPVGMTTAELVVGLTAHAAGEPTMNRVRADVVEDMDVVVLEERPGDGSVVLWRHRIVDGWQLSVGCQFRDATIPQVRPVCDGAVVGAGVIR